ncbi:MAG TPA: hypothetical protein VGK67_22305 [Myxococcales bacterium]|jgi:hypothetical protein
MFARALLLLLAAPLLCTSAASAAELVLVETPFDARDSTVIVRDLSTGSERTAATLPHAPGFGAAGSLSPDGRWLAAAVLEGGNRLWRHAAVWAVDLDGSAKPKKLLAEAIHSAPIWLDARTVVAVRSVGEHEPSPEEAKGGRLLDLDIEVVAVAVDAAPKVLLKDRCNALDPFGVWATGEIALLRASSEGHSLLALGLDGRLRRLADLGPMTPAWPRLTPDRTAATFQQIAGFGSGRVTTSLVTSRGERRDLAKSSWLSPTPVPVAHGAVASSTGQTIALLSGETSRTLWTDAEAQRLVPRLASADGKWLVVERVAEGPARPFVLEVATGKRTEAGGAPGRWRESMGLRRLP